MDQSELIPPIPPGVKQDCKESRGVVAAVPHGCREQRLHGTAVSSALPSRQVVSRWSPSIPTEPVPLCLGADPSPHSLDRREVQGALGEAAGETHGLDRATEAQRGDTGGKGGGLKRKLTWHSKEQHCPREGENSQWQRCAGLGGSPKAGQSSATKPPCGWGWLHGDGHGTRGNTHRLFHVGFLQGKK